jgi:hypothetical protein
MLAIYQIPKIPCHKQDPCFYIVGQLFLGSHLTLQTTTKYLSVLTDEYTFETDE